MIPQLLQLIENKDYLRVEEHIKSLPVDLSKDDRTHLFLAVVETGDTTVIELLVRLGWKISDHFDNHVIIFLAAKSNNHFMLKLILDAGYDLSRIRDYTDTCQDSKYYGRNPDDGEDNYGALKRAVENDNIEMVKMLLNAGWRIPWDWNGLATALHKRLEMAILMLETTTPNMTLLCPCVSSHLTNKSSTSPDRVQIYEWMRDHGWPLNQYALIDVFERGDGRDVLRVFLSKTPKGVRWMSDGYNEICFENLLNVNEISQSYELQKDFHKEMFEMFILTAETAADLRGIKRLQSLLPGLDGCERTLPL